MSQKPRSITPYTALPARAFWRPAVASRQMMEIDELWTPKFELTERTAFATYGSCFAQHFGRALKARGLNWLVTEPAPPQLSADQARTFNFNAFTSRTGNIYTTSLLRQWVSWASGSAAPPEEIWTEGARVYDPFRPAIEPDGFANVEEITRTRAVTIAALRAAIEQADVFVFTLGLTEAWVNAPGGYEYPMCPGTHAGRYDADAHHFINQDYPTVEANLRAALDAMREMNPRLKVLLTVSPIPLTATNSGEHVLVATMHSKAILRAVAGALAKTMPDVDYFPAYEIVAAPPFKGAFYQPNQRTMAPHGVAAVMDHFFAGAGLVSAPDAPAPEASGTQCEEALLDAFGPDDNGNDA